MTKSDRADLVDMLAGDPLAGKTWWITGASSGIGAALAVALAERGARLILSGRNLNALNEVVARCSTETLILPFEATDHSHLPEVVETAWAWRCGVNGLVSNAGISQRSLAVDTVFEVYERIISVDLMGPIRLTQELLPRFASNGGGSLVTVASIAGILGAPMRAAYSAAKAGLIAYHDSVRAEMAHDGVKVLVVAPGSVRTNSSRNALNDKAQARGFSDQAIDEGMDPDVAARAIVHAIAAGQRELILADGAEAQAVALRRSNPEQLFDLMAAKVANGYAKQLGAGDRGQGSVRRPGPADATGCGAADRDKFFTRG